MRILVKIRTLTVILIVLLSILLTGCWDQKELNSLAIVLAIGIDKAPNENQYSVSIQVVNPSYESSNSGSQVGTPFNIYLGQGTTICEAISKSCQQASRSLFLSHLQIIVISESVAQDGIKDLLDTFERSNDVWLDAVVCISKNVTAESVISTITPMENLSALEITKKIKNASNSFSSTGIKTLDQVITELSIPYIGEVIGGVRITNNLPEESSNINIDNSKPLSSVEVNSLAMLKNGKLIKWLNQEEAEGVLYVKNIINKVLITIDYDNHKNAGNILVKNAKTGMKITIDSDNSNVTVNLDVYQEGNIAGFDIPIDLSKSEEIHKLETELNTKTKLYIENAIKTAQEEKCDIFGFGKSLSRSNPKVMKELESNWDSIFSSCKVNINVKSYIRNTGLNNKPSMYQEN